MPPPLVRLVRHGSFGSGTRFRDLLPVPPRWVYLLVGTAARAVRRPVKTAAAVFFVLVWVRTGSLVLAVTATLVCAVLGLTGWLRWAQRRSGAAALSTAEIWQALRRRHAIRARWRRACRSVGLIETEEHAVPTLGWLTLLPGGGYRARIAPGRVGRTVGHVQKAAGDIAEIVGCREMIVTGTGPGQCTVEFHWADPVGRHLSLTRLPVAPRGTLAYGIRADGSPATIRYGLSVMIGGLTGNGKSNAVWALLADANRQQIPTRLYVSDPKGGMELDALGGHLRAPHHDLEVREYATDSTSTLKMVQGFEGGMRKRQAAFKAQGMRNWTPTKENPLTVLLLDETLALQEMLKKGADGPLGQVALQGRAVGYVIWLNAQAAQVDVIGRFRDFIPQRICFGTNGSEVTDSVLGKNAEAKGARCSDHLPAGVGYSYSEGDRAYRKFRAAFVNDAEVKLVADGRVPRGMLTRSGAEEALYRHFDADGQLLYVGKSNDPLRRTREHFASPDEDWTRDIAFTKTEWFPDRAAVLKAEADAIKAEKPVHNVQHNTRNPLRKVREVGGQVRERVRRKELVTAGSVPVSDLDTGEYATVALPPEPEDEPTEEERESIIPGGLF